MTLTKTGIYSQTHQENPSSNFPMETSLANHSILIRVEIWMSQWPKKVKSLHNTSTSNSLLIRKVTTYWRRKSQSLRFANKKLNRRYLWISRLWAPLCRRMSLIAPPSRRKLFLNLIHQSPTLLCLISMWMAQAISQWKRNRDISKRKISVWRSRARRFETKALRISK